ncbi:hypothetical protein DYU11_04410 [Fibrisoma montanum]|uniref:Uncharacterized protein n=1 Tax=Fibrisoma montanum TaxID=2305895 RepID=A0A418MJM3_9BACT|nr:hypothetical protein DYU11_04410 [Fibrisoma montanum]
MLHSLIAFLFTIKTAFCSCRSDVQRNGFQRARSAYKVTQLGRLPKVVNESSGLTYQVVRGTFLTHNDGGGRPTLYEIDRRGRLLDSIVVTGAANVDWEDMAQQDSTVLFVGDFGNNQNNRRDLSIYRIDLKPTVQVIPLPFHFADQTAFPPPRSRRNFDMEAMVWYRDSLHLFSKNRSLRNRFVRLYKLPSRPEPAVAGKSALEPQDSIYSRAMVTGAAVSPDYRTLALLTYGKILLFSIQSNQLTLRYPKQCIRLPRGQTEAVAFVSETDMVVTNERGKLYLITRK